MPKSQKVGLTYAKMSLEYEPTHRWLGSSRSCRSAPSAQPSTPPPLTNGGATYRHLRTKKPPPLRHPGFETCRNPGLETCPLPRWTGSPTTAPPRPAPHPSSPMQPTNKAQLRTKMYEPSRLNNSGTANQQVRIKTRTNQEAANQDGVRARGGRSWSSRRLSSGP